MFTTNRRRILGLSVGLGLTVLMATGADAPKQTIDAGELTFEIPASWKKGTPSSTMRKAQVSVPPVEGDEDSGELVVFVFPGGAGTVEANVTRWQGQFKDKNGEPPEVESKKVKGKNTDVTRVELSPGRYVDPFAKGGPKQNFKLLGAIVQTDDSGIFLKFVGPEKTMIAIEKDFDALISSINVKK